VCHPGLSLRVIERDGDPWFVAKDVCAGIDLSTDNVRRGLDDDEVKSFKVTGLAGRAPLIVSESGFYALVMRSNKPQAKSFRKWVTSVVLPAIRRDGATNGLLIRCFLRALLQPRPPSPCAISGVLRLIQLRAQPVGTAETIQLVPVFLADSEIDLNRITRELLGATAGLLGWFEVHN
jgi:hypothetical protein